MHIARQSWGEGTSLGSGGTGAQATNGDATWTCRFSNVAGACSQAWTTSGGDFSSALSATVAVNDVGSYTISSTATLVAAVKRWVDTPSLNFGWILIGDEVKDYSKEHVTSGSKLTVSYSISNCTTNTWTGAVSNAWETVGNWSCNMVPNNTMIVIINGGTVDLSSNIVVKNCN